MININTESIKLDREAKVQYSMDRLFVERPIRVPTVSFGLKTSEELTRVADQMRLYAGVKNRRRRPRGGYEFRVGAYSAAGRARLESCLEFRPVDTGLEDDGQIYIVPLSEYEREKAFDILEDECLIAYGKTCGLMLAEAAVGMTAV